METVTGAFGDGTNYVIAMCSENYFYLPSTTGKIEVRSIITGELVEVIDELPIDASNVSISKIFVSWNNYDNREIALLVNGNYYQFPWPTDDIISGYRNIGFSIDDLIWWGD